MDGRLPGGVSKAQEGQGSPSLGSEAEFVQSRRHLTIFFILNRVFYHYYTTTLLIILITTLQIRIIRVQLVINRLLLLGSWLLLLTHPPGTRVEINLDAVLSCNLAKELLNLECFPRTGRGTRRLLDGLEECHRIIFLSLGGSLGGSSTLERLSELDIPAFLELSQLLRV